MTLREHRAEKSATSSTSKEQFPFCISGQYSFPAAATQSRADLGRPAVARVYGCPDSPRRAGRADGRRTYPGFSVAGGRLELPLPDDGDLSRLSELSRPLLWSP